MYKKSEEIPAEKSHISVILYTMATSINTMIQYTAYSNRFISSPPF